MGWSDSPRAPGGVAPRHQPSALPTSTESALSAPGEGGDRVILVGRVAGAFGVRGEVRVISHTADPAAILSYGPLRAKDGAVALTPLSGRVDAKGVVLRAPEIATREAAEALKGLDLHVPRAALPPAEEDEYYLADLIGLQARSPAGEILGRVKSVNDFGAGDLLEIEPAAGGPTWWTPFTRESVPEVDLPGGAVTLVVPTEE